MSYFDFFKHHVFSLLGRVTYLAQVHEYAQITINVCHLAKMQDMEVFQISTFPAIIAYVINRYYILVLKIY